MRPTNESRRARPVIGFTAILLLPLLNACQGDQSVHQTGGPRAEAIGLIGWIMYWGAAAIFLLVLVLCAWAILAPPERRQWLSRPAVVFIGGIAFPVVVLTILLTYGLAIAGVLTRPVPENALRIAVSGERWWWRVTYLDRSGTPAFATANEIRIPTGQPVELLLTSPDVIHSFWVPALAGKLDMIPGRENRMVVEAERPGIYRGQCAEYCGAQHALMALKVVAEEPDAFEDWRAHVSGPAPAPTEPLALRGRDLFFSSGCGACHAIRGTEAAGLLGPDLTDIGSRQTLAAASFPNNPQMLARWIVDAQHLKPGVLMPEYDILSAEDAEAIAVYLEGLK